MSNLNQKHSEKYKAEVSLPNQTKVPSNPTLCLQLWPVMDAKKTQEGGNI